MPLIEHIALGAAIFLISFELRHWTKLIFEITLKLRQK